MSYELPVTLGQASKEAHDLAINNAIQALRIAIITSMANPAAAAEAIAEIEDLVEIAQTSATTAETARDEILAQDRRVFPTRAAMAAAITYTAGQPGSVVAGDRLWQLENGVPYRVAAAGASDHNTALNGVKLYVESTATGRPIEGLGAPGDGTASDSSAFAAAALIGGAWSLRNGANYRVANVTLGVNGTSFSCAGVCNITKNANGPIFDGPASDMNFTGIIFRGGNGANSGLTGHNLDLTGARNTLTRYGSMWAHGRAIKSAQKIELLSPIAPVQTDDTSATGYCIEIGNPSTSTNYCSIQDIDTTQPHGGLLLINPGVVFVSGCQFGKLTTQNIGSPAGIGGGLFTGNRINGNVSIGVSNTVMTSNAFSAVSVTLESGVTGCWLDNIHAIGSTVVNNAGNANTIVRREGSVTSNNSLSSNASIMRYGPDASSVWMSAHPATKSWEFEGRVYAQNFALPNNGAFGLRNTAGTLLTMLTMDASNNVVFGSGSSGGYTVLHGGTSTYFNIGGSSILQAYNTGFRPVADNAITLGTTGQAWQDVQAHKITTRPKTVATLPAGAIGAKATVTDSTVVAIGNFGAIVAGGGANVAPVWYDGTNWRIG